MRGLHHPGLALLAHLRRGLAILGVHLVPLLDPVMYGLRSLNDGLAGDVFFVAACQELEEFNLLLRVEMSSDGTVCDKLSELVMAAQRDEIRLT